MTGKCIILQFSALSVTSWDWLFEIRVVNKYEFPSFSSRFQCELDKNMNMGGSEIEVRNGTIAYWCRHSSKTTC